MDEQMVNRFVEDMDEAINRYKEWEKPRDEQSEEYQYFIVRFNSIIERIAQIMPHYGRLIDGRGVVTLLALQREELSETRKIFEKQTFENTFFQMLRLHHSIVDAMRLWETPEARGIVQRTVKNSLGQTGHLPKGPSEKDLLQERNLSGARERWSYDQGSQAPSRTISEALALPLCPK